MPEVSPYIGYGFGKSEMIDTLKLYPRSDVIQGYPKSFVLQASTDGKTYYDVLTVEDTNNAEYAVQTYSFAPIRAAYVRLAAINLGNVASDGKYYLQLEEMEVSYSELPVSVAALSSVAGAAIVTYDKQYYDRFDTAKLSVTTDAGYRFVRWESAAGDVISYDSEIDVYLNESVMLKAVVEAIAESSEYMVSFLTNSSDTADFSKSVTAGGRVTKPDNPVKAGYDFIGWQYFDGEQYRDFDFATAIEKDTTLYAVYKTVTTDKTALSELVASLQTLNESEYTEESYAKLSSALSTAQSMLSRTDCTEEEIQACMQSLSEAVGGLQSVEASAAAPTRRYLPEIISLCAVVAIDVAIFTAYFIVRKKANGQKK